MTTTLKRVLYLLLALLALLIGLFFPYIIDYYYTHIDQGQNLQPVKSPDGRYEAFINIRGLANNQINSLVIQENGGVPKRIASHVPAGAIRWSPDSRRVVIFPKVRMGATSVTYTVVDVPSGRKIDGSEPITADWAKKPEIDTHWQDANTLVVTAFTKGQKENLATIKVTPSGVP